MFFTISFFKPSYRWSDLEKNLIRKILDKNQPSFTIKNILGTLKNNFTWNWSEKFGAHFYNFCRRLLCIEKDFKISKLISISRFWPEKYEKACIGFNLHKKSGFNFLRFVQTNFCLLIFIGILLQGLKASIFFRRQFTIFSNTHLFIFYNITHIIIRAIYFFAMKFSINIFFTAGQ